MTQNLYINQDEIKKSPPPLSNPCLLTATARSLVFLCVHTERHSGQTPPFQRSSHRVLNLSEAQAIC